MAPSPFRPTATVTVRALELAALAVAVTVTVLAEAPSLTLVVSADSETDDPSLSLIVTLAPTTCPRVEEPSTQTVSLDSTSESSVGVSLKEPVAVLELAAKVKVMSETVA